MITLKEHNLRPYKELCEVLSHSDRALYTSATGTGKSYVAGKYIEEHIGEEHCLILTPAITINESWRKMFPKAQILTYQSLLTNTPSLKGISCILCDEAHHLGAELWGAAFEKALKSYSGKLLGLSATPIRYLDNYRDVGMEKFEGNIVQGLTVGNAVNEGILPSFHYVSSIFQLSDYIPEIPEKKMSETTTRLLGQLDVLNSEESIQNILKKHFTSEQKTIVFCPSISDCYHIRDMIAEEFPESNHSFLNSGQDALTQSESMRTFESSDKHIFLYVVDMLNEGVHVKGADSIIMLRKTSSPNIFLQQLGRALDAGSDKDEVLVFDFVGNLSGVKGKRRTLSSELHCINEIREQISNPERHIVVDDYLTGQQEVLIQLQKALGYHKEFWTPEEDELVHTNHHLGPKKLAELLPNHTRNAVTDRLVLFGYTTPHVSWTKEEDDFLKANWQNKSTRESCYEFCGKNHSRPAIKSRAHTLGLLKKDVLWTKEETDLLRKVYPQGGISACIPLFPNRQKASIQSQAAKLGIHKEDYKQSHTWTPEELQIIKDTLLDSTEEVKKRLGFSVPDTALYSVRAKVRKETNLTGCKKWSPEDTEIIASTMDLPLVEVQKLLSREAPISAIRDKRAAIRKQQRLSEAQAQKTEELNNSSFMIR